MDKIPEPYRSRIIEILKSSSDTGEILHNLKIYLLNESYFKELTTDPAWLANEIYKQSLKNRRTKND